MTLNVPTISILNMLRRTNGVTSARMNTSDARSANGSISLPGRMKASRMVIGMSSRPVASTEESPMSSAVSMPM